ncbi:hypothetical protein RQP54_14760 [Curvibacter sp. APW13]|uniref:hypothetical protein n=1 Tax=Curvibacter sp. APW13 TaxID=3077236 RepID=UPI0028DEB9B1|nr:hypothetical protein [Curvibacter sp. APW13]MDT8992132.1 hypothetical protein [Curvibacter sp. APW13]
MDIHQLQASYQADQDRILLRLSGHNGIEQRVWLTRRMLKGMMVHLQRLADHLNAQREDGTLGSGRGESEAAVSVESRGDPSGVEADSVHPKSVPLLATALHVSPGEDHSLDVRFDEVHDGDSQATRSIEATLGPELLAGLVQLIDAVLRIADWDLHLRTALPDAQLADTQPSPLDAFADAPRPKYLN